MEDSARTGLHDFARASRKAEEAAWRRFQAVEWLESLVGPLGVPKQPSERDFISCLRNGLILCNAINKIQPGAVPKVVESQMPLQSLSRESQALPAYQYFENVRNFLAAVEELKLPAFEASDLERDAMEAGSAAKVVDCVLALKSYYEWKQMSNGNGFTKYVKSPLVMVSANRLHSRASTVVPSDSCRHLDMSAVCERQPPVEGDNQKVEVDSVESVVKLLFDSMVDVKENIDDNVLASYHSGDVNAVSLFRRIMKSCLEQHLQKKFPELNSKLKDPLKEKRRSTGLSTAMPLEESSAPGNSGCCRACLRKGNCNHRLLFQTQEKELVDLKTLWLSAKRDFEDLQTQLNSDLKHLVNQVQELSTAALGYYKVVKENQKLYNMVQDLKGNIRVYCRIRPSFSSESGNVISFIGEDGSLVISDSSKPQKDGRKVFQFNRVFGPTARQDEVFKDTQPLIRSVMDGYNVCIFAYGQTGSGKTHTMSGPSGGSAADMGINYLALSDLFQMSNKRKDIIDYDIHVQMVEIYNEQVRDLLAEDSSTAKLEIRSCAGDNGLSIPGATMHSVKSTTDVLNLMKFGETNRMVSSTAINSRSSRSHSVLTVHVHGKDTSGGTLRSCLHLVDLAGSERVDKSEVTGDRLKEAQYINKSLSCLGDVIAALAQKNSHIPYRNSKLTLLLQDSLGGHAKTLMLAHVSPEEDSFGETISTLKFAQRVSTVELGAAHSNKESGEVMKLKEQIESLKKALANKEGQCVPRTTTERTPQRLRRLSIESCSTVKTEKAKTSYLPTRSRRLSLEGPRSIKKDNLHISHDMGKILTSEAVAVQEYGQLQSAAAVTTPLGHFSNEDSTLEVFCPKAPQSPTSTTYEKQVLETDSRTQVPSLLKPTTLEPRPRTPLSPESATYQKRVLEPGSRTEVPFLLKPTTPEPCPRNLLSPASATYQKRVLEPGSRTQVPFLLKPTTPEPCPRNLLSPASATYQKRVLEPGSRTQVPPPQRPTTPEPQTKAPRSPKMAPRSPRMGSYQKQGLKADNKTQVRPFQLPTTPEPKKHSRNEVQIVMQSKVTLSTDYLTPNLTSSTSGKGSQIRKSLRTIGKLINGSEKRNQQSLVEAQSSVKCATNINDANSPVTNSARTLRRQSLTGIPPPGYDRRSSLGGKPTETSAKDNRNAKTPPPVRSSTKSNKRWL